MAKATPCNRCGIKPKESGQGKRYCPDCKSYLSASLAEKDKARRLARAQADRQANPRKRRLAKDAPPGTKWCSRCQQYLTLANFGKRGSKLAAYCKDCSSSFHHGSRMAKVFGITVEQYDEMLVAQGGKCAVCGTAPRRKRLAVDHDHQTGVIRGLLCTMCNHKVLGGAKDDLEILRAAVRYLEDPPAIEVIGEIKIPGSD